MRREFVLLCIVLSALCIIVVMLPGGDARDIHVDKDDADPSVQVGSEQFPYDSIDEANQGES